MSSFPPNFRPKQQQPPEGAMSAQLAQPMNDMQVIEFMAAMIYAGRTTLQLPEQPGDEAPRIAPMTPQLAAAQACAVFVECRVLVREQGALDVMLAAIRTREGMNGPTPEQDAEEEAKRKARREGGPTLVGENGV